MRDTEDAIEVLARADGLHPPAVAHFKEDRCLNRTASGSLFPEPRLTHETMHALRRAQAELIEVTEP
jgi:hypothetical protein